jgi:hypothetical protein
MMSNRQSIYDLSKMKLTIWQWYTYNSPSGEPIEYYGKWTVNPLDALRYNLRESKTFGPFKQRASVDKITSWWLEEKRQAANNY